MLRHSSPVFHAHGGETKDEHPYLYRVPLGKLEFAAYTLELYDTGSNTVTLMRRVEVKPAR